MDAKELKNKLNENNILTIMTALNATLFTDNDDCFIFDTICHGGNSAKLYYYKESKSFMCYSHCGVLDILAIVSEVKDLTLPKSIDYICTLLGFSTIKEGFNNDDSQLLEDWEFINSYNKRYNKLNKEDKKYIPLNKSILNIFQQIYTSEWINDGISKDVMNEYNILYSTAKQSIIIPHYDIDDNLIGVRQRALIDTDVEMFGKYTPFSMCGDMYNHPLGSNLYGINKNKEAIKRNKKVMLVESEKGVLQSATLFGIDNNFTLALCGCAKISKTQRQLLLDLGVNEVIIALDRQYETVGSEEYLQWQSHLKNKIINPLLPYFNVYVIWDEKDLLKYKESPTDVDREVLLKLMKNKIYIEG